MPTWLESPRETLIVDTCVATGAIRVRSRAMYVKTTSRKTKNGTVRYLHLAHNTWDPVAGRSVPTLLYGFGREDQLDTEAVRRLVASLSKLLDPADALATTAEADADLSFDE